MDPQLPSDSTSQYPTNFICSCRSSVEVPSSQMFGTTSLMFKQNHLCSTTLVNNSFQSACFVILRSRRPTTERHFNNNVRHCKTNVTRRWESLQLATLELRCESFTVQDRACGSVPLLCTVRNRSRCPHHSNCLRNACVHQTEKQHTPH